MVKDIAFDEGGLGFDSRGAQIRHSIATAATFLRSCVVQGLSRGDGPRHSLHASPKYREYNENLILVTVVSRGGSGIL